MHDDIAQVLLTAAEIQQEVARLGAQITEAYRGTDLVALGILKGSVVFLADLIRHVEIPLAIDFVAITSYGHSTKSSGVVRITKDLDASIENKHVLVVEDIIDTGLTLKYLLENLASRKPASLKVCTLLDKPERRLVEITPDYNGFQIPDQFVVGYGLDYAEQYRNLPYIGVLKPEIYR